MPLPRHELEGYKFVSAAHVCLPNERIIVDSTAAAFTVGLAPEPRDGNTFELSEAPNINQLSNNAVTLVCNPLHTIRGGTDTLIINTNDDHVQLTFNAATSDWQAVRTASAPAAPTRQKVFTVDELDNEVLEDGQIVMVTDNQTDAQGHAYMFFDGAAEGDYEIANNSNGFLNRLDGNTVNYELEDDAGADSIVSFSAQDDDFGDGINDLDTTFQIYLIKRHDNSTAVQSFQSGSTVIKVVAADDFEWHAFRRINTNTVAYMGQFTSDLSGATSPARVLLAAGSDANVSGTESLTLADGRTLADLGTDFDSIEFSVIDGSWDNAATGVVVDAETLVSSQAVKISGHGSSGTRYFINGDFSSTADTTITVSTDGGANNYRRFRMYGIKAQKSVVNPDSAPTNFTEAGTPLNGSSTREYVLQWNGTEIVNTLSKEKWTIGNIEYIVDHLTRHMTVLGFQNITSTGSVTWTEAFADTDYTFAHDIREAQSERGVLRVDTRSATSITYVLYDETGTGDSGSVVHFAITGRIT